MRLLRRSLEAGNSIRPAFSWRLVRIFYEPQRVFSGLQETSYVSAMVAMIIVSLACNLFVVSVVGVEALAGTSAGVEKAGVSGPELTVLLYCARTILRIANVLIISALLYSVLRGARIPAKFARVVAVCSYAAYAQEVVKFATTVGVLSYAEFSRVPLKIVTNATAFFDPTKTSRPVYYVAGFLDVPTIAFLMLLTIGLWKSSLNLRLQNAIPLVFTAWAVFIGLGYGWRH